jgi:Spy/CpxP family protein refolding chaperone
MGNRLKRTIIILSLTLNVLLVSFLIIKVLIPTLEHNKRFHKRSLFSGKNLTLSVEQKEGIENILKEFRVNLISYKQEMINKRTGIIDQLSSPEPDLDLIRNYVEESNKLESDLNLEFVEVLINLSNILGPGQNIDFLLKISRRWLRFGRIPSKEISNGK